MTLLVTLSNMADYQTKQESDVPKVDDDSLTSHKRKRESDVPKVDDTALGKNHYENGKDLMFRKQFAEGAIDLEMAIKLGSTDAKALLAYFLMRGREGLPVDRKRAFEMAYDGALEKSRACRLCLSFQFSTEVIERLQYNEDGGNAMRWLDKAMKDSTSMNDPDLVDWLYSLAQGMVLSKTFTSVYPPQDQTRQEANTKAELHLMSLHPGFSPCDHQYNLGMLMLYQEPKQAVIHLTNATRWGHPEALFQLARIYKGGRLGVEKDEKRGDALIEQAKIAGSKSAEKWVFKPA